MQPLKNVVHKIIYKEPFAYCAHPFITSLPNGEWLTIFNRSMRRPVILHPPEDPLFYNVIMRSRDQGATWSAPRVSPDYGWHGVETSGLTCLSDGTLLLPQWRFDWYPLEVARKRSAREPVCFPDDLVKEVVVSGELDPAYLLSAAPDELMPWARGNGGTFVHRSNDMGRTWDETVQIDTTPYSGGYGKCAAVELPDGDILLPLSDVPNYEKVFVVRSGDRGRSWGQTVEAARLPGHWFEEPCGILLPGGRVLLMLRDNQTHSLYQCYSADRGWTWSMPTPTQIQGYPGHVLLLPDGRLFCVYGVRRPPFAIQAVLSSDEGKTWSVDSPIVVRENLPNRDLGYPSAVLMDDRRIFVVYYAQDTDGVTCIQSTTLSL